MRSTFKVLFYVKKGSEKPNGNLPLMCRLTVDSEVKQFSCKMDVPPRLWDVKNGRATGKSLEAQKINAAVDRIRVDVNRHYQEMMRSDGYVTAAKLKDAYLGIGVKQETLVKLFEQHNVEFAKKVGHSRTKGTYSRYCTVCNHIKEFLQHTYRRTDIPLKELNLTFINDFEYFLRTEKSCRTNTVWGYMIVLKHIIAIARNSGQLPFNPFAGYINSPESVDRGYWKSHLSEVVLPKFNENRKRYLSEIGDKIRMDVKHFQKVITDFEHSGCVYTSDDMIAEFASDNPENFLFPFMEGVIAHLKTLGKIRTSETYAATLCSFRRFREDKDVPLDDMDSDMMMAYEAYLKHNGVSPNSSSFYMRNLRAVYNRAVEKGLTTQRFPFKHVYTGVDKTVKRAVPLKVIKRIKEMDFSMNPTFDFARDMFLISFYTRGMSFVDMAYLRKKDLQNGVLSYRRRKTGQLLFIKWEKCMQEIVNKYDTSQSNYLLPIIKPFSEIDERKQYIYAAHNINRCLKIIGKELGLSVSLTLYVARHAWASIAKSKNVPLSVISEGMGHDSEATTRIYLASLDTMAIDKANSMILKSL